MEVAAKDDVGRMFAIIASQRSGTHLLREVLDSSPHVAIVAEPFSREHRRAVWDMFVKTVPPDVFPLADFDQATLLLDQYQDFARKDFAEYPREYGGVKQSPTLLGLDIKYNQLKYVSPSLADLCAPPFLIEYFRRRQTPIVHLVRNNLLHIAISMIVANARGIWQNTDGKTVSGEYEIPIEELFNYIRWLESERQEFVRLTQNLNLHVCSFDDVVYDIEHTDANGNLREDSRAFRPLAAFLGVPNKFSNNQYIRKVLNRPYREIIRNYDAVVGAVKDSPYAQFAGSI